LDDSFKGFFVGFSYTELNREDTDNKLNDIFIYLLINDIKIRERSSAFKKDF